MNDLAVIPECYIDTNLIETLIPPATNYNHQKGCGTVANRMKGKLADAFAVGIIDKDKKELDYLNEFVLVTQYESLYLFKHRIRHHYIIQISPAIEQFILSNAMASGLQLNNYSLPDTLTELRYVSKKINSKKDLRFKALFKDIRNNGSQEFKILIHWITYLKEYSYQVDETKLKNF